MKYHNFHFLAKCPNCEKGCDKCGQTGFIAAKTMGDKLFTIKCLDCGECNGGRITDELMPSVKTGKCVWCDSPNTFWDLVSTIGFDEQDN